MLGPHILGSCLVTLRMRATRVWASLRCSPFAMAAIWLSALTSLGLVLGADTCASERFLYRYDDGPARETRITAPVCFSGWFSGLRWDAQALPALFEPMISARRASAKRRRLPFARRGGS